MASYVNTDIYSRNSSLFISDIFILYKVLLPSKLVKSNGSSYLQHILSFSHFDFNELYLVLGYTESINI